MTDSDWKPDLNSSTGVYYPFADNDFSEGKCFLCGAQADSLEHVFPKWLLKEFGLWDSCVGLLNGTDMPYRQLVIPCCRSCNSTSLSSVENRVRAALSQGPEATANLERMTLFVWCLKIFYGLVYRECLLPLNRRSPADGTIVIPEEMEAYRILHFLLQSTRLPVRCVQAHSDIPGSLFVFRIAEPSNPSLRFDYQDDVVHMLLSLRVGNVGVLAGFDMGALNFECSPFLDRYQNELLHPIQFGELGAWFFAKARAFRRFPKVAVLPEAGGLVIVTAAIAGLSRSPVFGEIEKPVYAKLLSHFLHLPLELVTSPEGEPLTWLDAGDGHFRQLPIDVPPWSDV